MDGSHFKVLLMVVVCCCLLHVTKLSGSCYHRLPTMLIVTGALEVSLATMCKRDRNHTSEVYVVGFLPTYKLPSKAPISLDPFLDPLIQEIEDGFIDGMSLISLHIVLCDLCEMSLALLGIEVDYALSLPGFPSGLTTIRHLILLWTGDHVAQCEVSKGIFSGKRPCRFCHLIGTLYQILCVQVQIPLSM